MGNTLGTELLHIWIPHIIVAITKDDRVMADQIAKFLHLICGTTSLGLFIASFYYISCSIQKNDRALIQYSLVTSYVADGIILSCTAMLFITAHTLVIDNHFDLTIPWIRVAYFAFSSVTLLWLINIGIKFFYLSKIDIPRCAIASFYSINIIIITLFMLIIHDAVEQSTWFDFLLRK